MAWHPGEFPPPPRLRWRVKREKTGEELASAPRERSGQFKPGVSGNPRGRPKGSRDPRTVILAQLVDADGAAIVGKLIEQAKAGEPWAVRLVVERILPRHERRVSVELPPVTDAESVGRAIAAVIDLAADSKLTLDEARAFLGLIEAQRKAIETGDLAIRLELLEAEKGSKWD